MTFTEADKKKLKEIEDAMRNARIEPSNGDSAGSFPNDIARLVLAQQKLNDLLANILMRML